MTYHPRDRTTERLLGALTLAYLSCVLYAGLTPFRVPNNRVNWVPKGNILQVGPQGIILSKSPFLKSPAGRTLEIWMRSTVVRDDSTILAFYNSDHPSWFGLRQSWSDLELKIEPAGWTASRTGRWYIDRAFADGRGRIWGIAANPRETVVYRDGVKVGSSQGFLVSDGEFAGQLVIGTSPTSNDSWRGDLRGIAIYDRDLPAARIARHYATWWQKGKPELEAGDECVALYVFQERSGSTVHNEVREGNDLFIPPNYVAVHRAILDPIWRAFNWGKGFWQDALINVAGFVPLGFLVSAYLRVRGVGRPTLAAMLGGAALSGTIELLQVLLPTRDSSMSDLIANTAGAIIGATLSAQIMLAPTLVRISHLWRVFPGGYDRGREDRASN